MTFAMSRRSFDLYTGQSTLDGSGAGQVDQEGAALAGGAVYVDVAVVFLGDAPGDGEAEAAAAWFVGVGVAGAVKALEDVGQIFRRDADAGVADFEDGALLLDGERQFDGSSGGGVFEGVVDEGDDDLFELIGLTVDTRRGDVLK